MQPEATDPELGSSALPVMAQPAAGFDYSSLAPDIATELRERTSNVRLLDRETRKNFIRLGLELQAIKAALPHGQFMKWRAAEMPHLSNATAENLMRVAAVFADKIITVMNLEQSTLYQLSAKTTPVEFREDVVRRLEAGEALGDREIKRRLRKLKKPEGAAGSEAAGPAAKAGEHAAPEAETASLPELRSILAQLAAHVPASDCAGYIDVISLSAPDQLKALLLAALEEIMERVDAGGLDGLRDTDMPRVVSEPKTVDQSENAAEYKGERPREKADNPDEGDEPQAAGPANAEHECENTAGREDIGTRGDAIDTPLIQEAATAPIGSQTSPDCAPMWKRFPGVDDEPDIPLLLQRDDGNDYVIPTMATPSA